MSRRRTYSGRENDLLQRLKKENSSLRKEVGSLRKQISRLNLDRFQSFKEALDRLDEIELERDERHKERAASEDRWLCWTCGQGHLRLKIWDIRGGARYQRVCDNRECAKRTKMKIYTPDVKE